MGRLMEPVGKYAKNPYYMTQAGTAVYCMEELCFIVCRDAFLLDKKNLGRELAQWIQKECGLPELAGKLYAAIQQNASAGTLAGILLEYAGYGTKKERMQAEELLRKGDEMDVSARKKAYADYLAGNGRYVQALEEYERILEEMPSKDYAMRSELLHNKGVALCRMFAFEEAAEAFLGAFRENPENKEAGIQYLSALRMSLSEEDYIAFVADHKEWYEPSLEVERRMERCRREYEASGGFKKLTELLSRKDVGFYEEVSQKTAAMKEKYRKMAEKP